MFGVTGEIIPQLVALGMTSTLVRECAIQDMGDYVKSFLVLGDRLNPGVTQLVTGCGVKGDVRVPIIRVDYVKRSPDS